MLILGVSNLLTSYMSSGKKCILSFTFLQMENSAYVPNPIPPPALVVFSQAGGLPEALRMQRPFNPQVHVLEIL